jgi:hypothetical protein
MILTGLTFSLRVYAIFATFAVKSSERKGRGTREGHHPE